MQIFARKSDPGPDDSSTTASPVVAPHRDPDLRRVVHEVVPRGDVAGRPAGVLTCELHPDVHVVDRVAFDEHIAPSIDVDSVRAAIVAIRGVPVGVDVAQRHSGTRAPGSARSIPPGIRFPHLRSSGLFPKLQSPTGPKFRRKNSAEPTMTFWFPVVLILAILLLMEAGRRFGIRWRSRNREDSLGLCGSAPYRCDR
jgi:hypothetical protein